MGELISNINAFVWGPPMISMIILSGLYFSIKTRFFQIRHLFSAVKSVFVSENTNGKKNGVSSFGAVCTALAATMGTGNIAGVAGAVAIGGAGAVFWMWVSAVFSAAVKLFEVVTAMLYRKREGDSFVGGPMYYIKYGLPSFFAPLGFLFALFGTVSAFGTGNMAQINTMTEAVGSMLSGFGVTNKIISAVAITVGIVSAITVGLVLIGGAERIGSFTSRLVPIMSLVYTVMCLCVILKNITAIPDVFVSIFKGAFSPDAVTGGAIGSVMLSVKTGFSRGVFSNEAGLGTAPMAYSSVKNSLPIKQGLLGIFEVFADTIVVCTLTAVTILSAKTVSYGGVGGSENVLQAFSSVFGNCISIAFCVIVCLFGFSSVIGWGLYGTRCCRFLLGSGAKIPFLLVFCISCVLGAILPQTTVWELSGALNGFMAIPNIIAILLLSSRAAEEINKYDEIHKRIYKNRR